MYSKLSKAREKFWITPELVEKLLPFLDPDSILVLARCYEPVAASSRAAAFGISSSGGPSWIRKIEATLTWMW